MCTHVRARIKMYVCFLAVAAAAAAARKGCFRKQTSVRRGARRPCGGAYVSSVLRNAPGRPWCRTVGRRPSLHPSIIALRRRPFSPRLTRYNITACTAYTCILCLCDYQVEKGKFSDGVIINIIYIIICTAYTRAGRMGSCPCQIFRTQSPVWPKFTNHSLPVGTTIPCLLRIRNV